MASRGERDPTPSSPPSATTTVALQKQQLEKPLQKFRNGEPLALGVTLIMLGVVQFSFGFPLKLTKPSEVTGMGVPWWMATLLIVTGSLTVQCDRQPNKPRVTACLATNIINAIATGIGILIYCGDLTVGKHIHDDYFEEQMEFKRFYTGVKIVLLGFTVCGLILNIVLAVFCCKGLHYCSPSANMPVVVVHHPTSENPTYNSSIPTD